MDPGAHGPRSATGRVVAMTSALPLALAALAAASAGTAQPQPSATPTPAQAFAAVDLEVGYLFLGTRGLVAYGRSNRWVGVALSPQTNPRELGSGAHLALRLGTLRAQVGARYARALRRSLLPIQPEYDHIDLSLRSGPARAYWAAEAELSAHYRTHGVWLRHRVQAAYLRPAGSQPFAVYYDPLRVVSPRSLLTGLESAILFPLGPDLRIGPAGQATYLAARRSVAIRGGLRLEVPIRGGMLIHAQLMPTLYAPDAIGARGGLEFRPSISLALRTGATAEDLAR